MQVNIQPPNQTHHFELTLNPLIAVFMEADDLSTGRRLRRLNLAAPILSTRRLDGCSPAKRAHRRYSSSLDASERVPFSWEQVPGTPKGVNVMSNNSNETPPPKLPPSRWHPSDAKKSSKHSEENNDYAFSDAMDMFSLSESLHVADSTSDSRGLSNLDIEIINSRCSNESPNFIIQRFLPDANALANTCAISPSKNLCEKLNETALLAQQHPVEECVVPPRQPFSKACGFGILIPWRMKHAICGLKDPIRHGFSHNIRVNGNKREGHSVYK